MAGEHPARELRLMMLSGASIVVAPLVFVGIIVLRKVGHRMRFMQRFWNKRLRREIARWT